MNVFERLADKLLETANKAADGLVFTPAELHQELLHYDDIISKHIGYFTELTALEKERFLERTFHFRRTKNFHYTGLDASVEIEVLISACAAQITFGLREYKMPF